MDRKSKHKTSNKISFERICKLLKVHTPEEWDELNIDSFYPYNSDLDITEEEKLRYEEEMRTEAWQKYQDAVIKVADELFSNHNLVLMEDEHGLEFTIVPKNKGNWCEPAEQIRQTINGMGPFWFGSLREFLDSGPYTAREAVLNHIGWIPCHYKVYGEGNASIKIDKYLRS